MICFINFYYFQVLFMNLLVILIKIIKNQYLIKRNPFLFLINDKEYYLKDEKCS